MRVAIVDDNRLVRETPAGLLRRVAGFAVASTAVADEVFMHAAAPDVVLLDVGLVDDDSLRVASAGRAVSSFRAMVSCAGRP
jgi:DNA-binding NarL/FixJ family response regulator